jgi:hypothetical protein
LIPSRGLSVSMSVENHGGTPITDFLDGAVKLLAVDECLTIW